MPVVSMPELSARTRLLVVAPHPDDETLATGVLIQRVLAAGGHVRVLLLTDGDDNPWPQRWLERRWRIDAEDRQRWGQRRHEEIKRALACLGLPESALQALGWPDMRLTARLRDDLAVTLDVLEAAFDAFAPNLLALPALGDRHPDHGAAHVMCRLALARREAPIDWLTYPVHGGRADGLVETMEEGTSAQQRRKLSALAEHATQMALSGARMRHFAGRPERYGRPGPRDSNDGRLPWRPSPLLQPFLRLLVANAGGVSDQPWRQWPVARDAEGGYRLDMSGLASSGPCFARLHLDWPSPWIFDHWGWCRL